jgi:hypothetical protein
MRKKIKQGMKSFLIVYVLIVGALFLFQRKMLYFPHAQMELPAAYNVTMAQETLIAEDGTKLVVWKHAPQEGMPVILYFHGNAGNLSFRAEKFNAFVEAGFGVYALSYRGYGGSEGSPSEQAIYADARALIVDVTQTYPLERIVLYGESLGTGVATQMATEFAAKATVLEAPFTSIAARAQEIYWFIPVSPLLKDRFDSLSKLAEVKTPLLIFHGGKDRIVPIHHGKKLFEAAKEPKQAVFFDGITHTSFDPTLLAEHVREFTNAPSKNTLSSTP